MSNIRFEDSQVQFDADDGRPALIAADGDGVDVDSLLFDVGTTSLYDMGFIGTSPYSVGVGTLSTTGAAPRIQVTAAPSP